MVLKGLNLQIEKGEIFALLGINGAGKTTALECMEGLRKYDSGTISVNGKTGIQLQSAFPAGAHKAAGSDKTFFQMEPDNGG